MPLQREAGARGGRGATAAAWLLLPLRCGCSCCFSTDRVPDWLWCGLQPLAPPPRSCCTLGGEAYDVWLAWTIVGALGFSLALVCTARLWQPYCCRRPHKQVGCGSMAAVGRTE